MTKAVPLPDERFLSTQELARILGLKEQSLRAWRVKGCGPRYVRLGDGMKAPVVYRWSDVEAWLEERTYRHTAEEEIAAESRQT